MENMETWKSYVPSYNSPAGRFAAGAAASSAAGATWVGLLGSDPSSMTHSTHSASGALALSAVWTDMDSTCTESVERATST